jgi:hypothetical protein
LATGFTPYQGMEPIESLKKIVVDRGIGVLEQPDLVESLMQDHCEGRRPEIYLLVSSLKEKVPQRLMAARTLTHREAVIGQIREQMQVNLGMQPEKAAWTANAWLQVLPLPHFAEKPTEKHTVRPPFWKKAVGHVLYFLCGSAIFAVFYMAFLMVFVFLFGDAWNILPRTLPTASPLFFAMLYAGKSQVEFRGFLRPLEWRHGKL